MSLLKGCLLVPTTRNEDRGLWFIFHHESDGILAFDITAEHPEVPYRFFKSLLGAAGPSTPADQIIYLGGPLQNDSAMIVLHSIPTAAPDAHVVSDKFTFHSFRLTILPGKPPTVTRADDAPARLDLGTSPDVLIVLGFRIWDMDVLEQELKDWQWTFLPASPDIVFSTPRSERLTRARLSIN